MLLGITTWKHIVLGGHDPSCSNSIIDFNVPNGKIWFCISCTDSKIDCYFICCARSLKYVKLPNITIMYLIFLRTLHDI